MALLQRFRLPPDFRTPKVDRALESFRLQVFFISYSSLSSVCRPSQMIYVLVSWTEDCHINVPVFLDRSAAKISECSQRSSPHSCTLQSRSMKYRRCFSIVYCMIVMLLGNRDPLQVCGDMLAVRSRRSRKYSPVIASYTSSSSSVRRISDGRVRRTKELTVDFGVNELTQNGTRRTDNASWATSTAPSAVWKNQGRHHLDLRITFLLTSGFNGSPPGHRSALNHQNVCEDQAHEREAHR